MNAKEIKLRFECPTCGQHISSTPVQSGNTVPCPNCNTAVTVPNAWRYSAWSKALKIIGLIVALIAATIAIGLLQPLSVFVYLYVMAPLYHWLGLNDLLTRLLFCASVIFVGMVAYVWIKLQLDKRRSKKAMK